MSVIIKAKNVTFSNPNLPVLTPLISDGLLACFRPTSATTGLLDLSGNGGELSKIGNPTLTEKSIIVDKANGFTTNIKETMDLTLIVVHRAVKNTQATGENQWLGAVAGTYYDDRGSSIFISLNSSKNQVDVLSQSYAKKTSDSTMQSKTAWHGSYDNASSITQTLYQFSALVVKASDNKILAYNPLKQSTPLFTYDGTTDSSQLNSRRLSDPVTNEPNFFKLGIANVPFGDGKSEIAEVLIYNRALTQDEIMRQYKFSQEFMAKHRGISI